MLAKLSRECCDEVSIGYAMSSWEHGEFENGLELRPLDISQANHDEVLFNGSVRTFYTDGPI